MDHVHRRVLFAAFLFTFTGLAAAQPVVTTIDEAELPRSGRLVIEGSGFGAAGGAVLIAGLPAWTTTWTDARVVAFVPEQAPLGLASVAVVVDDTQSNEASLTVTLRQSDGRVRWTFEADTNNLWWRPALAPDGTIYLHSSQGFIYALSPDGGLKWTQKVVTWPYVPPSAGPDGALYAGSISYVYRISPQGQIDWQFHDPGAQGIHVSPTIGPDGRLCGVFDVGIGAFALDPATGQLEWSNSGDPHIYDFGTLGTEMTFGPSEPGGPVDQFYFHMDGGGGLTAFGLDGDQRFTHGVATSTAYEPAVGSDGTIYMPVALGLWIAAFDPADGTILWQYPGGWASGADDVEIGPDDTLYFVGGSGSLEALDPHSQSQQWAVLGHSFHRPTISPDGTTLVVTGVADYGVPGFVKGFKPSNGHEQWTVDLAGSPDPEFRTFAVDHPRITPDSATAYVSTMTGGQPTTDFSYLYAIDITSGGGGPGGDPCNNDGICSAGEDCTGCPGDCPGQTSGNPADRWCCGDGECSGPEDGFLCPLDCGTPVFCGDGACAAAENVCDCPSDCGPAPTGEVPGATCADGFDNDCDGSADCDDADCAIAESVFVSAMSMSEDETPSPILTFHDSNPPSAVTGYNVYRCDDPGLPPDAWPQVASDANDTDDTTPDQQWVDTSGDVAPGGIWYYQVTAYSSVCSAEGPF